MIYENGRNWQREFEKHMMKAYKDDIRRMENRRKGTKRYNRRKKKVNQLMEFKHQGYVFYKYGDE